MHFRVGRKRVREQQAIGLFQFLMNNVINVGIQWEHSPLYSVFSKQYLPFKYLFPKLLFISEIAFRLECHFLVYPKFPIFASSVPMGVRSHFLTLHSENRDLSVTR